MPHDSKGRLLVKGARVLIPAIITEIQTGETHCNVSVESVLGRRPDGLKERFGCFNTGVLLRAENEDLNTDDIAWAFDSGSPGPVPGSPGAVPDPAAPKAPSREPGVCAKPSPRQPQKPSVGRKVHYYPPADIYAKKGQPWTADITHVNDDGTVNLDVSKDATFDLLPTYTLANVKFFELGETVPPDGGACCWPPYVG